MIGFDRRRDWDNKFNTSLIGLEGELDNKQIDRLKKINRNWNFYEGYHWEEIPEQDTNELTVNYCRAFVNKFVSFELGNAFSFTVHRDLESLVVTPDERTLFEFLEDVWEDNNQYMFATEMGQMKSVTGEAWIQARYFDAEELDDPYGEYEDGRIKLMIMPTSIVFPEYDPHDKDKLTKLTIMYSYEKVVESSILKRTRKENTIYKQVWTKEQCMIIDGKDEPLIYPNKYDIIPFVQIKNLSIAGRTDAVSDLDDIIPMNVEYNMKESNISEIIDYHSAPVTVVYGAKVGNLEKGANKMWGGLAKDAKVQNLELNGDLGASYNYVTGVRMSMCEVGGLPDASLGGSQAISNTSGVALQYLNLPLIEKTKIKKQATEDGLERLNKLILLIALSEGLIFKPETVKTREFFHTEVTVPDTLPKDYLIELQQIQIELSLGLEDREGALKRLGRENIDDLIKRIDKERKDHPELYMSATPEQNPQLNSGMTNGQTPQEQMNIEMTGQNKQQ